VVGDGTRSSKESILDTSFRTEPVIDSRMARLGKYIGEDRIENGFDEQNSQDARIGAFGYELEFMVGLIRGNGIGMQLNAESFHGTETRIGREDSRRRTSNLRRMLNQPGIER